MKWWKDLQFKGLQPIVTMPVTMHVPVILLTVRNYSSSHFVKMHHIAILIARTASLKKDLYILLYSIIQTMSHFLETTMRFCLNSSLRGEFSYWTYNGSILNTRDNSWCSHLIPCSVEKRYTVPLTKNSEEQQYSPSCIHFTFISIKKA